MDAATNYNLRAALSDISRVSNQLSLQLALGTSDSDPTLAAYVKAAATFKESSDLTLARFRIALQAARNAQESALDTSQEQEEEEKVVEKGPGGKEMSDSEEVVEHREDCHKHCGACLKEIADALTDDFELRVQTRIVPSMQFEFHATVEEDIAEVEPRVLKRLEQHVAKYSYSHPMMLNIVKIMTRRLAPAVIRAAEFEVYVRAKERIVKDFGDLLSAREKEALIASDGGSSDPLPSDSCPSTPTHPSTPTRLSVDAAHGGSPRGSKRPSQGVENSRDDGDGKRERI